MSVTNNVLNKVMLMGHLGQEPMIKQFESGSTMASFSLATDESYVNASGSKIENTQWHRLVAWGDVAPAPRPLSDGKVPTRLLLSRKMNSMLKLIFPAASTFCVQKMPNHWHSVPTAPFQFVFLVHDAPLVAANRLVNTARSDAGIGARLGRAGA